MVSASLFIKEIDKCKVTATTREDRHQCLNAVNKVILKEMKMRWGNNSMGCYGENYMAEKNFGVFFVQTLHKTGQDFNDVKKFDEPICEFGKDVLPITTDNNKKIFFKTRGTTERDDIQDKQYLPGEEIVNHQEALNVANLIMEDVPNMLHSDPNNNLIATEGITGEHLKPTEYDDAPPMEIADALLFETIVASWDRWNNIFREGDIIKEIDFGVAGRHLSDRVKEHSDILSRTPEKIIYRLKHKQSFFNETNIKNAIKSNIIWYRENKNKLKTLAPKIFDETIVSERIRLLEDAIEGNQPLTTPFRFNKRDLIKYKGNFHRINDVAENSFVTDKGLTINEFDKDIQRIY